MLISKRKNLNNEFKKNILFAPSWNKSSKNLFNDYSLFIIQTLIENGYSVTLRPHPELIKKSVKILKKKKKNFKKKKLFFYKQNKLREHIKAKINRVIFWLNTRPFAKRLCS